MWLFLSSADSGFESGTDLLALKDLQALKHRLNCAARPSCIVLPDDCYLNCQSNALPPPTQRSMARVSGFYRSQRCWQ